MLSLSACPTVYCSVVRAAIKQIQFNLYRRSSGGLELILKCGNGRRIRRPSSEVTQDNMTYTDWSLRQLSMSIIRCNVRPCNLKSVMAYTGTMGNCLLVNFTNHLVALFHTVVRDQSRSASISLSHFPFSFITFLLHLSFSHLLLDFMQPFHMLSFYIYAMLCDYHIAQPHDVIIHACFIIVSLIDGIHCMVSASIRPLHCLLM